MMMISFRRKLNCLRNIWSLFPWNLDILVLRKNWINTLVPRRDVSCILGGVMSVDTNYILGWRENQFRWFLQCVFPTVYSYFYIIQDRIQD